MAGQVNTSIFVAGSRPAEVSNRSSKSIHVWQQIEINESVFAHKGLIVKNEFMQVFNKEQSQKGFDSKQSFDSFKRQIRRRNRRPT